MELLGRAYASGISVAVDAVQAVDWYRRGADVGNTEAMIALADLYSTGADGVSQNRDTGTDWLRCAAEKGDSEAMVLLAERLGSTEGGEWLRRAANLGDASAMYELGYAMVRGERYGVKVDQAQGAQLLTRAAELGEVNAMCGLGECLLYREGVAVDEAAAFRWFHLAGESGDARAMSVCLQRLDPSCLSPPHDHGSPIGCFTCAAEARYLMALAAMVAGVEAQATAPQRGKGLDNPILKKVRDYVAEFNGAVELFDRMLPRVLAGRRK